MPALSTKNLTRHIPPIQGEKSFYKTINQAIAEKRHVEALKGIIKEYEDYKKYMSGVFEKKEPFYQDVFKFRVDYLWKKPVWREFEIEGSQTFGDLAKGIIESMGWDNDHLHAFYFPEIRNGKVFRHSYSPYSIGSRGFDNDQYPTYHTNMVRIAELDYVAYPRLNFVFDFGDSHEFSFKYIGRRASKRVDEMDYLPKVIDQRGVGPEQYLPLLEDE